MISQESLTATWLDTVSLKNNRADKILVEKVIRALLLLEGLVKADLKFVFKGGTALMLLMESTKRLSIDIDIIVSEQQDIDQILNSLLSEQGFTRFERQDRKGDSDIKKSAL